MHNPFTIPTNLESRSPRTNPKLLVVFTPDGMVSNAISADTEQEQAQMEGLLSRIKPYLDEADSILKKGD